MSAVLQTPVAAAAGALWYSAAELAGLPGLPGTRFGLQKLADRYSWPRRLRAGQGGGFEYPVHCLPAITRIALAHRHTPITVLPSQPDEPSVLGSFSAAHVSGWRADRRDAKTEVLAAFRRFWQQQWGGPCCAAMQAFVVRWNSGGVPTHEAPLARTSHPVLSYATLYRWHRAVEQAGLAGITPRGSPRRDEFSALDGELGQAVLALLTDMPHLSAAHIYRVLSVRFDDLPSPRAFRRALAAWKQRHAQVFTALTNPDAWKNKFRSAAGSADEAVVRPNQLWQMDSTPGDLLLADGARHAVVGLIDVYTRRTMWLVARSSRSGAIMALIRRAVREWGVPDAIKTDNGQDYTARQLDQALLGLGIEHPLCTPFSPEQKPHIERAIGTLMHDLFELLPGFVGHNVAERRDIEARRSFAQRLMQGDVVALRLQPEQLQAQVDGWAHDYHARPHGGLGGRSPAAVLQSWRGVLRTVDERALDLLLMPASAGGLRTVGKKGLRLDTGAFNAPQLAGWEGRQVLCKVGDDDLGRAYVFSLDGTFICEALDYERLGISSAEVAAQRRARQAEFVREHKAQLKAASKALNTRDLVDDALRLRTERALAAAPNVVTLPKPRAEHTTPATESIVQAHTPVAPRDDASLQAALARVEQRLAAPAAVARVADTPEARYRRWLRLQARVQGGDALASAERHWFEVYGQGSEHAGMKRFFEAFGMGADDDSRAADG